ncbi:hypothetical protein NNJEOMEG_02169 [Fundidesulfovibrio magnetotacticus]|uniref:Methyl-accepting transducer domain-containing protein n=1 Tax=Fundidesulfovibrio magnetotacticus TaxID=2730080 RepID=A0A6V8LX01_9BACT|nr:methyl-accepting chemotaxis protein [Fundidesulfovibrio magnetotacticus]GFK94326.1 hypothetical protein NNJEOMEG_02169 [Fundidesulfovibrio magnetotacticus]
MSQPQDQQPVDGEIQLAAARCVQHLEGLGAPFLAAFHSLENEFLRLGRELEGFNYRAAEVARQASELAEITSGDDILRAASTLRESLEVVGGACGNNAAEADAAGLAKIAEVSVSLSNIMRDFSRLVKHLTMLGIATRIESARIGGKGLGFATLADDVEKLAGKIESASDKILGMAVSLANQCTLAHRNIEEMAQSRSVCSQSVVELFRADLQAMEELMAHSRVTAGGISEDAGRVLENVSEAVLSMQFHDIVRQQLEHVGEALDEARVMAQDGPLSSGGHDAADWNELGGWVKDVLALQRSQLENAGTRFEGALQTVRSSLEGISSLVSSMADRARSLASKGGRSVLGQIEEEVRHIAASMREYHGLEQRMSQVMQAVGASIADMTASVAEIEEVGSEIELIAINASVKAAHTGDEGKPLGVLASAIQKLSVDARSQTERIMELLGSVDQASLAVDARAGGHSHVQGFEEAVEALDGEVTTLRTLEEQASAKAQLVGKLGGELSEHITAALGMLDFKHDLMASLSAAGRTVDELVVGLETALPPGAVYSQSPRLRQMLDRYTMDAERLVHENVLGAGGGDSGGDGDDNVELF